MVKARELVGTPSFLESQQAYMSEDRIEQIDDPTEEEEDERNSED